MLFHFSDIGKKPPEWRHFSWNKKEGKLENSVWAAYLWSTAYMRSIRHSSFESAGINQTKHSITIDIHVVITILTWTGTQEIAVDSAVVAAETVIVGTVPTTYFGMEELP